MQNPEWKGYLLGNPDSEGRMELAKFVNPNATKGWGSVLTPDEVRYVWNMGNSQLVNMTGQYFTDEMLQGWIDQTIWAIAEELQHDIYPVQWRHRPIKLEEPRYITEYERWDDPYYFKNVDINKFHLQVRRKPLIRVDKWLFVNAITHMQILDLLPHGTVNYDTGDLYRMGIINGGFFGFDGNTAIRSAKIFNNLGNKTVPGSYYVDYVSGYDHASRVPSDLKDLIAHIFEIKLLSAYGDGIVGGMANFSISIGGGIISESVGTTMSATSAYFGARIMQLQGYVKDWLAKNESRYKGVRMVVL